MNDGDRRLLPPMAMLHSFAAAARRGGFSRAADALGLTQGAVSRQVAGLERWLGTTLFERRGRRVALNEAGRAYLAEIGPALDLVRRATARLVAPPAGRVVELATLPGFGMRWLAPRLPRLTARHPDIVVNITARADIFDFADEPFDAAIHVGQADWPGADHDPLFREHVVPVVAPALAAEHGLRVPADLLRVPLLVQSGRREAWARWFADNGLVLPRERPLAGVSHFLMLAQAVGAGAGAALLPTFLIEPELQAGTLTVPIDRPLVEDRCYFLVHPRGRPRGRALADFRAWMIDEARTEPPVRG